MKHDIKITLLLLGMFLVTQLIGLVVVNAYSPKSVTVIEEGVAKNVTVMPELPYGMQPPEVKPEFSLFSIVLSIIFVTVIIFLLARIKAVLFLRLWFFFVIVLALAITFYAAFNKIFIGPTQLLALVIALPLAFRKVFNPNVISQNFSELLIYPGIAAVFVPILNVWVAIALLVIIAIYDVYAVWKAKFMQKLAKFQIQHLRVFAGFFVPYLTKKERKRVEELKKLKGKNKGRAKEIKIKVHLAILGGGDVAFPLIFAGVVLRALGLAHALTIVIFATISLALLLTLAKKGKFYPAMPFLSTGCLIGYFLAFLI